MGLELKLAYCKQYNETLSENEYFLLEVTRLGKTRIQWNYEKSILIRHVI
tara:strand:+ start:35 stop:184 length:150 start_codon:yes stop_codon:yes gene_type:complete